MVKFVVVDKKISTSVTSEGKTKTTCLLLVNIVIPECTPVYERAVYIKALVESVPKFNGDPRTKYVFKGECVLNESDENDSWKGERIAAIKAHKAMTLYRKNFGRALANVASNLYDDAKKVIASSTGSVNFLYKDLDYVYKK